MRGFAPALAAVAGAAACLTAVDAGARAAAPAVGNSCGRMALVALFWPRGHGPLPALGLPASRVPHVELYRFAGSRTYRPANFVGSVQANGRAVLRCRGEASIRPGARFAPWRLHGTKLAVSCAFVGAPTVQLARIGGLWRARLLEAGRRVVLEAMLSPVGGSRLGFTTARCRSGPAPG